MKKLIILLALSALTAGAQTNLMFTGIKVVSDPVKSNFNQITLNITNLNANQTYALLFTRRLDLGFVIYIGFSSPSNSMTIVRQTTNSINLRFYEVVSTNALSFAPDFDWESKVSEFDEQDMVCEICDQDILHYDTDEIGDPFAFPEFGLARYLMMDTSIFSLPEL